MPDVKPTTVSAQDPQAYEDVHVHAVYDEIAPHFSSTRYKPWPIIAAFLSSLLTGSVGVDLGTGNGKYLPLPYERPPGSVWTVGLDRSINLLKLAKRAGDADREVVWGDVLDSPWRRGAFDYAISIATIHHLATPARRVSAIQRLLESISPSQGRALIYVWAIEQDDLSKRSIPGTTEDAAGGGPAAAANGQDVFVPWVLAHSAEPKTKSRKRGKIRDQGTTIEETSAATDPPKVFDRYYHMFAKGELRQLVCEAAIGMGLVVEDAPAQRVEGLDAERRRQSVQIVQDGWERSNYYVELRRWER